MSWPYPPPNVGSSRPPPTNTFHAIQQQQMSNPMYGINPPYMYPPHVGMPPRNNMSNSMTGLLPPPMPGSASPIRPPITPTTPPVQFTSPIPPRPIPIFTSLPPPKPSFSLSWGARSIDLFEIGEQIGEGTYGKVFLAKSKETGETVALKKINMNYDKEGVSTWLVN
eukprot:Colp12_sorted_trinity150504_noHs@34756